MAEYNAIKIVKGSGGFGGPLVVKPEEGKDKLVYITGGGAKPDIVDKIEIGRASCRERVSLR